MDSNSLKDILSGFDQVTSGVSAFSKLIQSKLSEEEIAKFPPADQIKIRHSLAELANAGSQLGNLQDQLKNTIGSL